VHDVAIDPDRRAENRGSYSPTQIPTARYAGKARRASLPFPSDIELGTIPLGRHVRVQPAQSSTLRAVRFRAHSPDIRKRPSVKSKASLP